MDYERGKDPGRADEVLRELVDGTISPKDAATELWCMADQWETLHDDPGEALFCFKRLGLEFEAHDPAHEFDIEAWRSQLIAFAHEVLGAGGADEYDRRLEQLGEADPGSGGRFL